MLITKNSQAFAVLEIVTDQFDVSSSSKDKPFNDCAWLMAEMSSFRASAVFGFCDT